jgi:CubicO group peptidase (beta-lactamase class C family)
MLTSIVFLATALQTASGPQSKVAFSEYIRRRAVQHKLPGLWVCLMQNETVLNRLAIGYSDLEKKRTASVTEPILIGSISKPMTGYLAGCLIHAGKLNWNSKVRDWIPELPRQFPNHPSLDATLLELLGHRSGLPSHVPLQTAGIPTPEKYRRESIKSLFSAPGASTPGSEYKYGGGLIVAAEMMCRATDQTYEQLMRTYVFGPLGMKNSKFGPSADGVRPYFFENESSIVPGQLRLDTITIQDPGGSIACSIEDCARFGAQYGRIGVNNTLLREMLSVPFKSGVTAASLWWEGKYPGWFCHNGSTGRGEYSWLVFNPSKRISIAVYYNLNRQDGSLNFSDLEWDLVTLIERNQIELGK